MRSRGFPVPPNIFPVRPKKIPGYRATGTCRKPLGFRDLFVQIWALGRPKPENSRLISRFTGIWPAAIILVGGGGLAAALVAAGRGVDRLQQRGCGKGGGLAGAFGGVGGSSAFGSRAGDMFTRITLIVAGIWLLLAMVQVVVLQGVYDETKGEGGTTIILPGAEK